MSDIPPVTGLIGDIQKKFKGKKFTQSFLLDMISRAENEDLDTLKSFFGQALMRDIWFSHPHTFFTHPFLLTTSFAHTILKIALHKQIYK